MNLWRPFEQDFIRDPYPHYKRLRDEAPVYQTIHKEYVITRHADVRTLAGDPRCVVGNRSKWVSEVTASTPKEYQSLTSALSSFLVFRNPPEHTQLRKFMVQAWSERSVAQLVASNLRRLSAHVDWRNANFVTAIAEPLPALTMAAILGVPESDYPWLIQQSHQLIKSMDTYLTFRDLRNMETTSAQLTSYFVQVLQEKKRKPDHSLASRLIEFNPGFSDEELSHTCLFLFVASEETTASAMSMAVMNMIRFNLWSDNHLKAIPLEKLLEELLRLDSPTQIIARTNTEDIVIGETVIPAHSRMSLCLGAANRDERAFPEPDLIIPNRVQRHSAFGAGIHHCLGDWLARTELHEMLKWMTTGFTRVNLLDEPVFRDNLTLRGLSSLRIEGQYV